MSEVFDVAVVGGGVVGCAVARLLSHHQLSVVLLEAGRDLGAGVSKANTAILHTGFDATPGSLEARLVKRGYKLLTNFAMASGVAVERTGAALVAWTDEQAAQLTEVVKRAHANGYVAAAAVSARELYELEPNLGPGALGGVLIPGEHIIDPWSIPLAFAHDAIANGAVVRTRTPITDVVDHGDVFGLGHGVLARFVVNAAGLYGDVLHRALGFDGFTIRPRRGELVVFDKFARGLLRRTILPVPTSTTKGVLIAPTVFGNVMLGPTAEDLADRESTGSTATGIAGLLEHGRRIMPRLLDEDVTAVYAGLRPATEHSDYQISHERAARYVCLGGIRSTGLTASMAIAEETLERLKACGLDAVLDGAPVAVRMMNLGESRPRPYQDGGRIACHCERVTADEIAAACRGPLPATDLDGVRRRTRALAGRCQGFYCLADVVATAAQASGRAMAEWTGIA